MCTAVPALNCCPKSLKALYSLLDILPVLGAVAERDMAVEMVDWYWSRQESKASL